MNRFFGLFLVGFAMIGFAQIASATTTTTTVIKNSNEAAVCTADAKVCPDGSAVGRMAPNCEFAACPDSTKKRTKPYTDKEIEAALPKDCVLYFDGCNNCSINVDNAVFSVADSRCTRKACGEYKELKCLKQKKAKEQKRTKPYTKEELRKILPENCVSFNDGCNACSGNISKNDAVTCTEMACGEYKEPKCSKVQKDDKVDVVKYEKSSWLQPLFDKVKALENKLKGLLDRIKKLIGLYTDDSLSTKATSETLTTKFTYATNPNITVSFANLTSPVVVGQKVSVAISTSSSGCKIDKVDFVINGELTTTDESAPFEFEWVPDDVGTYKIKAVVQDCKGLAAYATKSVEVVTSSGNNPDNDGQDDSDVSDDTSPAPTYTKAEVAKHATVGDCWNIIDGKVFDMSEQSKIHPVMFTCGGDGSIKYHKQHGDTISARQMEFYIGELSDGDDSDEAEEDNVDIGATTGLTPKTELFVAAGATWNTKNLMVIMERENRSLLFIDGSTHQRIGRISDVGERVHTSVFSPDGNFAYHISRDGWLTKIDLRNLQVVSYVRVGSNSRGTGLIENGKVVAVGNYQPTNVVFVDTATMKMIKQFELEGQETGKSVNSRAGAVVEHGTDIIVALKDLAQVWIFDASNPADIKIAQKVTVGTETDVLHDGYLTPDGKHFIISVQGNDNVAVIDMTTMKKIATVPTGKKPHTGTGATYKNITFVPALDEGNITAIDINTWKVLANIKTGSGGLFIRHYSGNPNYKYVWADAMIGEQKDEIYVIDAEQLKIVKTLKPVVGKKSVHPEFTLDGKFVYVAVWEADKIYVYDANTFAVVATIDAITPSGISNVGLRLGELGI